MIPAKCKSTLAGRRVGVETRRSLEAGPPFSLLVSDLKAEFPVGRFPLSRAHEGQDLLLRRMAAVRARMGEPGPSCPDTAPRTHFCKSGWKVKLSPSFQSTTRKGGDSPGKMAAGVTSSF